MTFIEPLIEFSVDVTIDFGRVLEAMAIKTGRALYAAGYYARDVMRAGIKAGTNVSSIGSWPISHTGRLRNAIEVLGVVKDTAMEAAGTAGRYAGVAGRVAGKFAITAIIVSPLDDILIAGPVSVFEAIEGRRKRTLRSGSDPGYTLIERMVGRKWSIPQLINDGGTVTVRNVSPDFLAQRFHKDTSWPQRITRITTGYSIGATSRYVYRPRPFIGLTLPRASAKLVQEMRDIKLK